MVTVCVPVVQLNKNFFVSRFKPIRFNGESSPSTPQRATNFPDEWDTIYLSKREASERNRSVTIGLAELDESMNYCKYFVRDKGNSGYYVREGKSFPVDGSWVGIQDFDNFPPCQGFVRFLEVNGWRERWFELMDRYK